jgi:hypothetical protein
MRLSITVHEFLKWHKLYFKRDVEMKNRISSDGRTVMIQRGMYIT